MIEPGPWQALAAYLYVLGLDDIAMAWEYLRRNPDYQTDWSMRGHRDPATWGLAAFENPAHDARDAEPLWTDDPAPLELVPALARSDAPRLCLWCRTGARRLFHDGRTLRARISAGAAWLRFGVSPDLGDGGAYAYRLPAGAGAEPARLAAMATIAALEQPRPSAAVRPARRDALVRMRTLAAIDGAALGASERDIGILLFGCERIGAAWSSDSSLRAQVRYLLQRGRNLVAGGYRDLLAPGGLRP